MWLAKVRFDCDHSTSQHDVSRRSAIRQVDDLIRDGVAEIGD